MSAQTCRSRSAADRPAGLDSFQGSVTVGSSAQPIDLTLDDAIQRGLKNNLGVNSQRHPDGDRARRSG